MPKERKFNFSSVTENQKKAISRITEAEEDFLSAIDKICPWSPHYKKAKRYLHMAAMQCNASILFNKIEK